MIFVDQGSIRSDWHQYPHGSNIIAKIFTAACLTMEITINLFTRSPGAVLTNRLMPGCRRNRFLPATHHCEFKFDPNNTIAALIGRLSNTLQLQFGIDGKPLR